MAIVEEGLARAVEMLTVAVKALGVPTLLLIAMSYAMYQAVVFSAEHLAKPLISRHIKYLDAVEQQMVDQNQILDRFAKQADESVRLLGELNNTQQRSISAAERAAVAAEQNKETLRSILDSTENSKKAEAP